MTEKNVHSAGTIFDLQKYAIHDGPGIRTTVFFKGCPLRCRWCHNPESWSNKPELMFRREACLQCGVCATVCPNKAIVNNGKYPVTKPDRCVQCGGCIPACAGKAREIAGRIINVQELIHEIERDIIFYDSSQGGVTLSGGEPLAQADFAEAILQECRKRQIHTAVDTCCYGPMENLSRLAKLADLFLCDIKHMDGGLHAQYTGVDNTLILNNIRFLAEAGSRMIIRVPVVPGFNDTSEHIASIAQFVQTLKTVQEIDLLPYHSGGVTKARKIQAKDAVMHETRPSDATMLMLKDVVEKYGFNVRIGG